MLSSSLLLLAALVPQSTNEAAIDAIVTQEMQTRKIQGLNLYISKDDKVIFRKAYGKADIEDDVAMTPEFIGETGSIGKSFTATVILQLVEEGKLSLDDTLEKRLPNCPVAWKAITLRQCLNQVTGLPDYALIPGLGLVETWTYEQWLTRMATAPFDFPTGKVWAYSNSNYLILGKVAEQAGGEPYLDLVQKRIFDKLGMKRSFPGDQMAIIPKRMHGYMNLGTRIANGLFIPPGYGDGSFMNSCEDLAAYEKGIRDHVLLKPESVAVMQSTGKLPSGRNTPYGMGWFIKNVNGIKIVSHGGNTAGFMASLTRIPGEGLTITLLGNIHDQPGDAVAQHIAEVFVPGLKPRKMESHPDPDAALTTKLLAALKNLAARTISETEIDPEMVIRLNTARGRMALPGLAKFASLDKLDFLEATKDDPDTVHAYRAKVGDKQYVLTFTVSKDKKVYSIGQREEI